MQAQPLQFAVTGSLTFLGTLIVCTLGLPWAPEAETAEVTDHLANQGLSPQEKEDVVRESLKIQQQLGGSLDQKYDLLQSISNEQHLLVPADYAPTQQAAGHPIRRRPPHGQHAPHYPTPGYCLPSCPHGHHHSADYIQTPQTQGQPIKLLRGTACELDRAANRLERANLYVQADALRELAQKLRLEARERQMSQSPPKKSP